MYEIVPYIHDKGGSQQIVMQEKYLMDRSHLLKKSFNIKSNWMRFNPH